MAEGEDRHLAPSEKRLARAREEGSLPISKEVAAAGGIGAGVLILTLFGSSMFNSIGIYLRILLEGSVTTEVAARHAVHAWAALCVPLLLATAAAGAGSVLSQSRFAFHPGKALPDLTRLDPRRGLKRVLGPATLGETAKSIVKVVVLGWAVWSSLQSLAPILPFLVFQSAASIFEVLARQLSRILLVAFAVQSAIAVLDVLWARYRFYQRHRMSREEQKQEHREAEGDPRLKAKLRQIRMTRSRRRMIAAVENATVVITNPTHYAVALAYTRGGLSAPKVVAKGTDEVAARIRAAAQAAGVPLVANPPLARALHELPLDAEVPPEHFKVVAEVIAYVYRLKTAKTAM